ncbi:MAG: thioredoxin domain-containing protein [Acidobacteria bacterium]|nr:thioredoxin domain-containing protein [Acidobacteriota bacterium]
MAQTKTPATAQGITQQQGVPQQQGITQQQGEEMLKELRRIRQALERLTQPEPAPKAPPADQHGKLTPVLGPVMGKPDAPLTLVEFTDLQCPYCNRFTTTTFEQIKKQYIDTGLVRFVSRDFPLDFHPQAMPAARAARCAADQGKFWEMRMSLLRNASRLSPAFITTAATELKLDMRAFAACASSTLHDAEIEADMAAGRSLGIEGTPTFLLGRTTGDTLDGVLIIGSLPFDAFDTRIKALLAPAGQPVK